MYNDPPCSGLTGVPIEQYKHKCNWPGSCVEGNTHLPVAVLETDHF